jgi:hypothetical protein
MLVRKKNGKSGAEKRAHNETKRSGACAIDQLGGTAAHPASRKDGTMGVDVGLEEGREERP